MKKFVFPSLIIILMILSLFSGYLVSKILNNNYETASTDEIDINGTNVNNSKSVSNEIDNSGKMTKEKAEDILKNMTLEEKVGQMFLVRCISNTAIRDIENYHIGGFILFDSNIVNQTKESLTSTIQNYQSLSKTPLLIAIDEEGGIVNRLSWYSEFRSVPFYSPQELYNEGGYPLIISDTKEKAELLKSIGINVNLAPVADISTNPYDFIYERTFGKDIKETSKYIETVISTMKEMNMGSTLKHFPGYGSNLDTHTGFSIDERSYESFKSSDFIPFEAGIKAGADSILVSHNIVKSIDENLPASLSPNINKIIRNDLDFNKVIMTDDLQMDAIKEYIGDNTSAILAIKAGNDLLISSDFDVQIPSVLEALRNGEIDESRLDESVLRILYWKINLGLL